MIRFIRAQMLLRYVVHSAPRVGIGWIGAFEAARMENSEALNALLDLYYPLPKNWRTAVK